MFSVSNYQIIKFHYFVDDVNDDDNNLSKHFPFASEHLCVLISIYSFLSFSWNKSSFVGNLSKDYFKNFWFHLEIFSATSSGHKLSYGSEIENKMRKLFQFIFSWDQWERVV